jgi:hypothetical protein
MHESLPDLLLEVSEMSAPSPESYPQPTLGYIEVRPYMWVMQCIPLKGNTLDLTCDRPHFTQQADGGSPLFGAGIPEFAGDTFRD